MSNAILNHGFVSPYIDFTFSSGNRIDTIPPRYFLSFDQRRSVKEACTFTLTLIYAPGNFGESDALLIHNLLLSNVNRDVEYQYGYKTPGGGITLQNQRYTGMFLKYTETINEGYLTYTITGIASAIDMTSVPCNIDNYIGSLKRRGGKIQPSSVIKELIYGTGEAAFTGISEYFRGFNLSNIDCTDEDVSVDSYNIQGESTIHDVFMGKSNTDGTSLIGGIACLGVKVVSPQSGVSNGLISSRDISLSNGFAMLTAHGASSQVTSEMVLAHNRMSNLNKVPFVCYFDNVLNGGQRGSFNYVPKIGRSSNNIFNYDFGNDYLNSDVLSFNADCDWTAAVASIGSLANTKTTIDADGQNTGGNFVTVQSPGFSKNVSNSLSGFDESAFLSSSVLGSALNFPFNATMTVVGQTQCNQLMDTITVNVSMNGIGHPVLSGQYIILDIEDSLSDSGFTTTFKLIKKVISSSTLPDFYTNSADSAAGTNQQAKQNDYS